MSGQVKGTKKERWTETATIYVTMFPRQKVEGRGTVVNHLPVGIILENDHALSGTVSHFVLYELMGTLLRSQVVQDSP